MELRSESYIDTVTVVFPQEWNCAQQMKISASMRISVLIGRIADLVGSESVSLFYDEFLTEKIMEKQTAYQAGLKFGQKVYAKTSPGKYLNLDQDFLLKINFCDVHSSALISVQPDNTVAELKMFIYHFAKLDPKKIRLSLYDENNRHLADDSSMLNDFEIRPNSEISVKIPHKGA